MAYWNFTADEIQSSTKRGIALLPLGSTEQHGPHLPVATDSIIAELYAKRIGQEFEAYVLPVLPIGTCREHMGRKGSVWINPKTMYDVISDVVLCLKSQGFRSIIILIAHGGLFITGPVIRELNATNNDIKVIRADITIYGRELFDKGIIESADNLHACEVETSLLMHFYPELVKKDRITDFIPDVPRDYLNYRSMPMLCPEGVWGMPSLASPNKGEKIFEYISKQCVSYIRKVMEHSGKKGYVDQKKGEQII